MKMNDYGLVLLLKQITSLLEATTQLTIGDN